MFSSKLILHGDGFSRFIKPIALKSGKDEFHLVPLLFENYSRDAVERVLTGPGRDFVALWPSRPFREVSLCTYKKSASPEVGA